MKKWVLAIAVALASSGVLADDFKWSHMGVNRSTIAYDDGLDAAATSIGGSVAVHENIYAFGSLDDFSIENDLVEGDGAEFGVGFHKPLADKTAGYVGFSFWDFTLKGPGGSVDGNGTSLGIGVRHQLLSSLELSVSAGRSMSDGDAENSFAVGGVAYLTPQIGVGAGYSAGDGYSSVSLNVAAYF